MFAQNSLFGSSINASDIENARANLKKLAEHARNNEVTAIQLIIDNAKKCLGWKWDNEEGIDAELLENIFGKKIEILNLFF